MSIKEILSLSVFYFVLSSIAFAPYALVLSKEIEKIKKDQENLRKIQYELGLQHAEHYFEDHAQ